METQIIDFHTHIYPVALARRAMEVVRREGDPYDSLPIRENLLRRMEEADISLSVVQPVVSRPETQTDVNRFAREIVRTNLISFGGLHPDCPHVLEAVSYTHLSYESTARRNCHEYKRKTGAAG